MHEFNWNYVWAAVAVNFLLVYIVTKVIKKPTGVKVIDDVVLFLNSQKGSLLSSSIIVAIVMWLAHYWVDSQTESGGGRSSPSSEEF